MTVCHENINTNSKLSFYDKGVDLPMGIKFWNHFHSVSQSGDEVYIEDLFEYRHKSKIVEMMLYPVMIAPIVVRKVTYKLFLSNYLILFLDISLEHSLLIIYNR